LLEGEDSAATKKEEEERKKMFEVEKAEMKSEEEKKKVDDLWASKIYKFIIFFFKFKNNRQIGKVCAKSQI
jgi:hypothetical protein